MKNYVTLLTAFLAGCLCTSALACGDSLYLVGKGVSYRVYTAPLPGSVLVYGRSEGAQVLAEALAESGHHVEYVNSELNLSLEVNPGEYDVVIATYDDHKVIESALSDTQGTIYLPVARNEAEAKIAEQDYDRVMLADRDEIKNYLKAIHKSLKSKA